MVRRGFTIIELLVVISIIALLIAILLPSLAGSRDRARFIKWAGYSHSLRSHQSMNTYYNFEQQGAGHTELWNRAGGDALRQAKEDYEPESFNGDIATAVSNNTAQDIPNGNMWADGRWKGKGALDFNGANEYVLVEDVPIVLQEEWSVMAWARPAVNTGLQIVIATRRPSDHGFDFKFNSGGNREIHGDIGNGSNWLSTTADWDMPGTDDYAEQWWNVIYSVNRFGYTIYVNGKEVVPHNTATPPSGCCGATGFAPSGSEPIIHDINHDIYLGRYFFGGEQMNGLIDEVAIFQSEVDLEWAQEIHSVGKVRQKK